MMRIGYGEDIHLLVEGRRLVLGGIEIPYERGLLGHSDADVVYHAISDALLGALALGDIGKYFPPNDDAWKDIDSSIILEKTYQMIREKGYGLVNLDVAISCEKPKLLPYIEKMREKTAKILDADVDAVGIKAMTSEGVGPVGEGKAIRASAVILLEKE